MFWTQRRHHLIPFYIHLERESGQSSLAYLFLVTVLFTSFVCSLNHLFPGLMITSQISQSYCIGSHLLAYLHTFSSFTISLELGQGGSAHRYQRQVDHICCINDFCSLLLFSFLTFDNTRYAFLITVLMCRFCSTLIYNPKPDSLVVIGHPCLSSCR